MPKQHAEEKTMERNLLTKQYEGETREGERVGISQEIYRRQVAREKVAFIRENKLPDDDRLWGYDELGDWDSYLERDGPKSAGYWVDKKHAGMTGITLDCRCHVCGHYHSEGRMTFIALEVNRNTGFAQQEAYLCKKCVKDAESGPPQIDEAALRRQEEEQFCRDKGGI